VCEDLTRLGASGEVFLKYSYEVDYVVMAFQTFE
jgi:hypothetical protein